MIRELRFETEIRASPERVFDLLAELRKYDQWLPGSAAFHGTTQISEGPIGVGTTYIEDSPFGIRHGRITAFLSPTRLNFEQPMRLKPAILGEVGIRLSHTLTPTSDGVHLLRCLELARRGLVTLVMPVVARAFAVENRRMLRVLKTVAEVAGVR